ncbi:MAG: hypothetical protein FJ098_15595 [Deltaproteobacteria bacterium]|nr:hypothetical protein [Deltaproteobacteria bacterium]
MILPHLPPRPVSPWPRLLPLLLLLSCIDHTAGLSPTSLPAGAGGIAVVGSDYLSTSLAILDRATGSLLAEGVLHSGSAAPGSRWPSPGTWSWRRPRSPGAASSSWTVTPRRW